MVVISLIGNKYFYLKHGFCCDLTWQSRQLSITHPFCTFPCSGLAEWFRGKKVKLLGCGKGWIRRVVHHFPFSPCTPNYHLPTSAKPVSERLSPVLLFSMAPYSMKYRFGQFGLAVLVLFPPISLCTPCSSLARWYKRLKCPWLSVSTARQQLKLQCSICTIFLLNLNRSTTSATTMVKTGTYSSIFLV